MTDTTILPDHTYRRTYILQWKASDPHRRYWIKIDVKRMAEERAIWKANEVRDPRLKHVGL